jgi:hypothetical protein
MQMVRMRIDIEAVRKRLTQGQGVDLDVLATLDYLASFGAHYIGNGWFLGSRCIPDRLRPDEVLECIDAPDTQPRA